MPPLHQRPAVLPHKLVPIVTVEHTAQNPAEMRRVVKEPPAQHEAQGVEGHHALDPRGGGEDEEGQEDDLEVGVGADGPEDAEEGADGPAGAEAVGHAAAGDLVDRGEEGGYHTCGWEEKEEKLR